MGNNDVFYPKLIKIRGKTTSERNQQVTHSSIILFPSNGGTENLNRPVQAGGGGHHRINRLTGKGTKQIFFILTEVKQIKVNEMKMKLSLLDFSLLISHRF